MSGHTHVSFYDDANYSNENGSLAHTVHVGSSSHPCGYGTGTKLVRNYDGRKKRDSRIRQRGLYGRGLFRLYRIYRIQFLHREKDSRRILPHPRQLQRFYLRYNGRQHPPPISNNDSSKDYVNVFHYYTSSGVAVEDECGVRSNDLTAMANAFNQREGSAFLEAEETLGGFEMLRVEEKSNQLVFLQNSLTGDLDQNGNVDSNDAIYVLFHVFFPDRYPLKPLQDPDYNKDSKIDITDVFHLLYHIYYPERFTMS